MTHTERPSDIVINYVIPVPQLAQGVEDGATYEVRGKITGIANSGGTGMFLLETGDKIIRVYLRKITVNGDEVEYQVTGGVTATHGTPVVPTNRKAGGPPSQCLTSVAPTGISGGEAIQPVYLPGAEGVGQINTGQFETVNAPRLLAPNTKYLATITNNGAKVSMSAEVYLQWTEYDD